MMAASSEEGCTPPRDQAYLDSKGVPVVVQSFFDDLFQCEELPANPYPDLVQRVRIAESAEGLFRSLEDDQEVANSMKNTVARSPELSGVTYVQDHRGIWGMPHMLQMVDVAHLGGMEKVLEEAERHLREVARQTRRNGDDYHINVWVALTGPLALAGKLVKEGWAEVHLSASVGIVTKSSRQAARLFGYTILMEAKGCQGSNRLLLQHVVVDLPSRQTGAKKGRKRTIWTPRQLHDSPEEFISHIIISLSSGPCVTMEYLFLSPPGSERFVGGPIMSIQRRYTMHHRSSTNITSSSNWPFQSLYDGVFLCEAKAKHYADIFRVQGVSFAVDGVAGAKENLAENVERMREVGDTLGVHVSLLPLALLSGVNDDGEDLARRAVIDISRVTRSAASRHRSLRNLCNSILRILKSVAEWAQASEPVLKWEDPDLIGEDSGVDEKSGQWNPKTRCRSSRDLVQTWLRSAHLLFWRWRCDVLRYLDTDCHSDVVVVKHRARSWIDEISSASRMGLRLPVLRWHEHGRTIADGKKAFLGTVAVIQKRMSSLSSWLHCLDLSLAFDAAKVCDRLHSRHVREANKNEASSQGGWSNLLGLNLSATLGQERGNGSLVPTAAAFLELQRDWLHSAVAAAHIRDGDSAAQESGKRRARRQKKPSVASMRASSQGENADMRYLSAPATPDSTRAPKGLDRRRAVVRTLREDLVPEAFAHEITLMKYVVDNEVDKALHSSVEKILTSVLLPNPYPVLTDDLAVRCMSIALRRAVDSVGPASPVVLKPLGRAKSEDAQVFLAKGKKNDDACVYGSKPALADVDVGVAISLFDALPPVAGWVLDELGGGCTDADVGILGSPRLHGVFVHHLVPSELTIMLVCACDFDLGSGTTPMEYFTRCVVRCAALAHEKGALLVNGLTARASNSDYDGDDDDHDEEEHFASRAKGGSRMHTERYALLEVLSSPGDVEKDLANFDPDEIVLEGFLPYSNPAGGSALVPLSIYFFLSSETADDNHHGRCTEASVATMFYNCVYSTAKAAQNAAVRHAALVGSSDPSDRHVRRTRRLVLEKAHAGDYVGAYHLVHHLGCLQSAIGTDEQIPTVTTTTVDSEADSRDGEPEPQQGVPRSKKWQAHSDHGGASAALNDTSTSSTFVGVTTVTTEVRKMTAGPAGRLRHTRQLMDVLHKALEGTSSSSPSCPAWERLPKGVIMKHAQYCTCYLLDTLAEDPLARLEGAVQSMKLRARLLLDNVKDIEDKSSRRAASSRMAVPDTSRETAEELAFTVASMLEIVELAVEADSHRCCGSMERLFEQMRVGEERTRKKVKAVQRAGRRGRAIRAG